MTICAKQFVFRFIVIALASTSFFSIANSKGSVGSKEVLTKQLIEDVRALSSNEMLGRKAPSKGHELAREYLKNRFAELQLRPLPEYTNYEQVFTFSPWEVMGKNILGYLEGKKYPELYFVITAHYDHLGGSSQRVYNGANDNASGVAAMLALMSHYASNPPAYSVLFMATDAEESGLRGAMYFVRNTPIQAENMVLNINIDMIGDGGRRNVLYMLPSSKNAKYKKALPDLNRFTDELPLKLKWRKNINFQRQSITDRINWREASDHAAFGRIDVPYLYFGADTNKIYHTTKDDFDELDQEFFIASSFAIIKIADHLQNLNPSELRSDGQ